MSLFKKNYTRDYKCVTCGVTGCKMWRDYGEFFRVTLKCAPCVAKDQKRDISTIDDKGTRLTPEYDWADGNHRSNEIGWWVPAIQIFGEPRAYLVGNTEELRQESIEAWWALPTLPKGYKP